MIQGTRKDPLCCGASNETATVQSVQWTLPRAACEHGWGGGRCPWQFPESQKKEQGRISRWKWPRAKILDARIGGKQKEFALMHL